MSRRRRAAAQREISVSASAMPEPGPTSEREPGPEPIARLWTTQQTAEFLGVSVGAMHQWRWRDQGPAAFRVGNGLRYDPAEVMRWLREDCREAG